MLPLGARARSFALGLISRVVIGRRLSAAERDGLVQGVKIDGFRKTLYRHLIRNILRGESATEETTVLLSALGGEFTMAASAEDFAVGRAILLHGVHEPHVVEVYRRLLRPGMQVLDVGANIGFHALHAASRVGTEGKVWAVEPDARNAALLRTSVRLAGGELPVEVIEAALSNTGDDLILTDLGNRANSGARFTGRERATLEPLVHGADPRFHKVRALRWDDHHADDRVDFVKIDIEGFEPYAMEGMEGTVERCRPTILSEFAPDNLSTIGGRDPAAYLEWFRERGYECAVVDEPGGELRELRSTEIREQLQGRHHCDLLFTHPAAGS